MSALFGVHMQRPRDAMVSGGVGTRQPVWDRRLFQVGWLAISASTASDSQWSDSQWQESRLGNADESTMQPDEQEQAKLTLV